MPKTKQLNHYQIRNEEQKFPLVIVCDNIRTPENVGMIFRSSEAFGVDKIYFCGILVPEISNAKVRKTARSTELRVPHVYKESTVEVVEELKGEGYAIVGLDITNTSVDIKDYDFKSEKKIVLVLGAEREGISEEVLLKLQHTVHISMFGINTSINAVNALSISLYEITKQLIA